MRTIVDDAVLALLLEVSGTPKPGNVDRHREFETLRFEHFLAGSVGAREGLSIAARGGDVGPAFERAIAGMADQRGGNTQFGALLGLVPLVRAGATEDLDEPGISRVVSGTTTWDAACFYRAFDHVDVRVDDPPADLEDLDVRRGSEAIPAVYDRGLTLGELLARSADRDGIAREWTTGFERSRRAASRIVEDEGPIADRAARAFLELLAAEPDTLVATEHGEEIAREVTERAEDLRDGSLEDRERFADDLVDRGINPGTTADLTAAALCLALRWGVSP